MEENSDLATDSEPEESVQMTEDNHEVEITPEQTEHIVTFSMSTGNEDLDECAKVLKENNWDLDRAVNATLAGTSGPPSPISAPQTATETTASVSNIINLSDDEEFPENFIRRRRPPMEESLDHDDVPPPPPIGPELQPDLTLTGSTVARRPSGTVITMLVSFMSLAVRSPWFLVKNTFSLVSSWWRNLGTELTPAQQVDEFAIKFNKKYDDSEITWMKCPYNAAVNAVRSNLRPVIVYLANELKTEKSDNFAQLLVALNKSISRRIDFWGCDIISPEAVRTADQVKATIFPCVLILGLHKDKQSIIWRTALDNIDIEDLKLQVERAEAELVTARHEAQVRQMDRSLREQQDAEFERTMEADRKRLEEARLKKESEERKLLEAEEKKKLVKRKLTETRERKISARNNLAVEPENGIRLQFKLPNGAKFIRKFVEEAPISDIFLYVESLEDSPGECFISSVFPVRKITPSETRSLAELGIKNNDQLMIQAVELFSSDEDESDESD